jgi:hypothetical protein
MPVSGSANPNEPPIPAVPNACSEEPKVIGLGGFKKPSDHDTSTCISLSRNPFVGGTPGFVKASRVVDDKPISEPPVAASPYSCAIDCAVPMPFPAGISTTRSSCG